MMTKISTFFSALRLWARDYQPALARAYVAVAFQMAAALGIGVGNLPSKADAVLAVLAVLATLLAGKSTQRAVFSPLTHRAEVAKARRGLR